MSEFWVRLESCLGERYAISQAAGERLEQHWELLSRWNKRINLTSIRDWEVSVVRHYAESVALAKELPAGPLRILDVGSGAGFPGIPVAVVRPDCEVTLLESDLRKAVFLEEAAHGLPGCQVSSVRLQAVTARFDCIVSRAVRIEDVAGGVGRVSDRLAVLVSTAQVGEWSRVMTIEKNISLPFRPDSHVLIGYRPHKL